MVDTTLKKCNSNVFLANRLIFGTVYMMVVRRAFTLIEVLTVITIIGILASLTGYVYSSSLSRTRDTQRLSDLRSIQGALEQFHAANRYYPPHKKNGGNLFLAKFQFEDYSVLAGCEYTDYSDFRSDFLVPRFLGEIPEDPHFKFNFNINGGVCEADPSQRYQYLYAPNDSLRPNEEPTRPSGFYLIARMERVNNVGKSVPDLGYWQNRFPSDLRFCAADDQGQDTCSHNYYLPSSRND